MRQRGRTAEAAGSNLGCGSGGEKSGRGRRLNNAGGGRGSSAGRRRRKRSGWWQELGWVVQQGDPKNADAAEDSRTRIWQRIASGWRGGGLERDAVEDRLVTQQGARAENAAGEPWLTHERNKGGVPQGSKADTARASAGSGRRALLLVAAEDREGGCRQRGAKRMEMEERPAAGTGWHAPLRALSPGAGLLFQIPGRKNSTGSNIRG
jgi:hypothetical protein